MNMNQTTLFIDHLTVGYKEKTILNDVSFECREGQFISLLGPNGAGKTTLLRTLSRHLKKISGKVILQQKPLEVFDQMALAREISVVLTQKVHLPLFKVYDFVALGRYPHTGFLGKLTAKDKEMVENALAMVSASDLSDRDINTLSDGERQKILIARAFAQEPKIILLDEPTMHLDLKHRMEVMTILTKLCREKSISVIASLHDVDIAAKVSDTVALVKDHQVMAYGTPEDVLSEAHISKLYDFNNISFNRQLGSFEIQNSGSKGNVFVIGGMGSAALLYRLLSKKGFSITTGVLHQNDLDYYVARSLGAKCILSTSMDEISQQQSDEALDCLDSCSVIIDTGFAIHRLNQSNTNLIQSALTRKKTVLSMRQNKSEIKNGGTNGNKISFFSGETTLVRQLETEFKKALSK